MAPRARPSPPRRDLSPTAGLGPRHARVDRLRRLLRRRTARAGERAFVLEGAKLVGEALAAGAPLEAVFVAPGAESEPVVVRAAEAGVRVSRLAPGVLERVGSTVTPQPILAVAPWCDVPLDTLEAATHVVVCVDVRDPGNAGTVLRSAEGAGADAVVLCEGSVEAFNPKTVRASAGALFHVPVVQGGEPAAVLDRLGGWGLRRLGAAATGGTPHTRVDLTAPLALVLGNEAAGLPEAVGDHLDGRVSIPLAGRTESLNVGMAAAVLTFEVARQRTATGSPAGREVRDTGEVEGS
jgi:TrmH family RNA methyltransferase